MFNFLFSKSKSNVSAPECDIHIDSIKELNIHVMAVLEGKSLFTSTSMQITFLMQKNRGVEAFGTCL